MAGEIWKMATFRARSPVPPIIFIRLIQHLFLRCLAFKSHIPSFVVKINRSIPIVYYLRNKVSNTYTRRIFKRQLANNFKKTQSLENFWSLFAGPFKPQGKLTSLSNFFVRGQTGRQTDRQTDRQADRPTDRQTDRQDRQTDRQTDRNVRLFGQ